MNQLIRNNVFETNSSSCHSITISDSTAVLDMLYPDSEGNITLTGGEFGWEIENYDDPITKSNYALVHAMNTSEENQQMLKDVIKEHTGCSDVIFQGKIPWYSKDKENAELDFGYIDHQSYDVANDVFVNKETLKNFIFNPGSILHTDNDNY